MKLSFTSTHRVLQKTLGLASDVIRLLRMEAA
ncbi:Uncharacterised protein [Vibrio cholerae]|nr:Uncharacterised protein [Vibrio cholerae]